MDKVKLAVEDIEKIKIGSYNENFYHKVKKHYKKYAKIYNVSFGLLAVALFLFTRKSKKRSKWIG